MEDQSFRDRISTIGEDGKRVWIYPKQPKGKYYNKRKIVSVLLLFILFVTPFIKVDGHPLFLFNILERKFILFGHIFWPQDFHLFALAMITMMVFIVLFSVIYGRIWCGWACPQTIFMEMVFRRIEYWIEGSHNAQKKLNAAKWNFTKIRKKLLKHIIFAFISFIIGNTLLAYVVAVDELKLLVVNSPTENMELFVAVIAFSALFYAIFSQFREQACTVVCPYGRLQGVFIDNKSMAVSYDFKRGEPRAHKRNQNESTGDCVDCSLCVQVCPTGIDIRNGLQMECVNCTACMDACDTVMDKLGKETGLIRYASKYGIITGEKFKFNPRIIAYSTLLLVLMTILFSLFGTRKEVDTKILRARGSLFSVVNVDSISNIYSYEVVNKKFEAMDFSFRVAEPFTARVEMIGDFTHVDEHGMVEGIFKLIIPKSQLNGIKNEIHIEIISKNGVVDRIETNFLGPAK